MLKRHRHSLREAQFTERQVMDAKKKAQKVLCDELDQIDTKKLKDDALDRFWHRSSPDYWALLWSIADNLRDAADRIEKEGQRFIDKYYSSDIAPDY